MRLFIESEVIRWAKSSQQTCSNNCDKYSKEKEKRKKFFAPLGVRLNPLNVSFASSRSSNLSAIIVDGYNSPPPCSTPR